MLAKFEDILSRVKEKPSWYDCNGTPRFGKFNPELSPNIYADEVLLVRIRCQNCHEEFLVEFNFDTSKKIWNPDRKSFEEYIKNGELEAIHYGDPPRHSCYDDDRGCVGDTMNCDDIEIVEFWKKKGKWPEWKRMKKMEIRLI
jgi:hypothetical protein